MPKNASPRTRAAVTDRCTQIADVVVPEYRGGRRSYGCTGGVAKRWQAAWDGACLALGHDPDVPPKRGVRPPKRRVAR